MCASYNPAPRINELRAGSTGSQPVCAFFSSLLRGRGAARPASYTSEAGEGRVSEASLGEVAISGFEALRRGGTDSVRGRRERRNPE
jgi:hypothetical protein